MFLKKSQMSYGKQAFMLTAVLGMFFSQSLTAETLLIQFEDLNIAYDGTDILDADPGSSNPDPITNTSITVDGVLATAFPTGVTADLLIPDVLNINVGAGTDTVFSSIDGLLNLDFGGGEFLDLKLDSVSIIYVDVSTFQFVFGATSATVSSQLLPEGLAISNPISVSFETLVDPASLTDDGFFLTGFIGLGTGSIQGDLDFGLMSLPEPATMALALFGLVAMSLGSFAAKRSR